MLECYSCLYWSDLVTFLYSCHLVSTRSQKTTTGRFEFDMMRIYWVWTILPQSDSCHTLDWLVGGLEHKKLSIHLGIIIIPIDELIFFRGLGLNHQPVVQSVSTPKVPQKFIEISSKSHRNPIENHRNPIEISQKSHRNPSNTSGADLDPMPGRIADPASSASSAKNLPGPRTRHVGGPAATRPQQPESSNING